MQQLDVIANSVCGSLKEEVWTSVRCQGEGPRQRGKQSPKKCIRMGPFDLWQQRPDFWWCTTVSEYTFRHLSGISTNQYDSPYFYDILQSSLLRVSPLRRIHCQAKVPTCMMSTRLFLNCPKTKKKNAESELFLEFY